MICSINKEINNAKTNNVSSHCIGLFCNLQQEVLDSSNGIIIPSSSSSVAVTELQQKKNNIKRHLNSSSISSGNNNNNNSLERNSSNREFTYQILKRVLKDSELQLLEDSGKLIQLWCNIQENSTSLTNINYDSVDLAQKEHRYELLKLNQAEIYASTSISNNKNRKESSFPTKRKGTISTSVSPSNESDIKSLTNIKEQCSNCREISVCNGCAQVYTLLDQVRNLLTLIGTNSSSFSSTKNNDYHKDQGVVNKEKKLGIGNNDIIQEQCSKEKIIKSKNQSNNLVSISQVETLMQDVLGKPKKAAGNKKSVTNLNSNNNHKSKTNKSECNGTLLLVESDNVS